MKRGLVILIILTFFISVGAGCTPPIEETIDKELPPVDFTEPKPEPVYIEGHVTSTVCDAENACPEDFTCVLLPNKKTPLCVDESPCAWYLCNDNEDCSLMESDPAQLKCTEKVVEKPAEVTLPANQYKLFVGDAVKVGSHTFTFKEFQTGPRFIYTVDARKGESVVTQSTEILEGLRISAKQVKNKGYTSPTTYVVFELVPLVLGENQYFMEQNLDYTIAGNSIKMTEVKKEDSRGDNGWAYITIANTGNLNVGFKPGDSKVLTAGSQKLKVTLLESYSWTRQYAIFQIETVTN